MSYADFDNPNRANSRRPPRQKDPEGLTSPDKPSLASSKKVITPRAEENSSDGRHSPLRLAPAQQLSDLKTPPTFITGKGYENSTSPAEYTGTKDKQRVKDYLRIHHEETKATTPIHNSKKDSLQAQPITPITPSNQNTTESGQVSRPEYGVSSSLMKANIEMGSKKLSSPDLDFGLDSKKSLSSGMNFISQDVSTSQKIKLRKDGVIEGIETDSQNTLNQFGDLTLNQFQDINESQLTPKLRQAGTASNKKKKVGSNIPNTVAQTQSYGGEKSPLIFDSVQNSGYTLKSKDSTKAPMKMITTSKSVLTTNTANFGSTQLRTANKGPQQIGGSTVGNSMMTFGRNTMASPDGGGHGAKGLSSSTLAKDIGMSMISMTSTAKGGKAKKKDTLRTEEGFDYLPDEFTPFDKSDWKDIEKSEKICELCECVFKTLQRDRARHHCRRCKRAVCTTCCANEKRLSKKDSTLYRVCDQCDFELGNPLLHEWVNDLKELEEEMLLQLSYEQKYLSHEILQQKAQLSKQEKELSQKKLDHQKKIKNINNDLTVIREHCDQEDIRGERLQRESNQVNLQVQQQLVIEEEEQAKKDKLYREIETIRDDIKQYKSKISAIQDEISQLPLELRESIMANFREQNNSSLVSSMQERQSLQNNLLQSIAQKHSLERSEDPFDSLVKRKHAETFGKVYS